jgi:hypothetical protein
MKKILPIIIALFVFAGCKTMNEASVFADKFYELLANKQYDEIVGYVDPELLTDYPAEEQIAMYKQRQEYWGDIKSRNSIGIETNIKNGVSLTVLRFKIECEKGTVYERLELKRVEGKEDFVITYYYFSPDPEKSE